MHLTGLWKWDLVFDMHLTGTWKWDLVFDMHLSGTWKWDLGFDTHLSGTWNWDLEVGLGNFDMNNGQCLLSKVPTVCKQTAVQK